MYCGWTCFYKEKPLEDIADSTAPMRWIGCFDFDYFLFNVFRFSGSWRFFAEPRLQSLFSKLSIEFDPAINGIIADLELLS